MSINFMPEYVFDTFDMASAEFLLKIGVKGIVLDIDNTLEPYENPEPGVEVVRWFHSLWNAGIKTAIVSNNNKERVELFNKGLKIPAYSKAKKPFKKNVLNAISDMGIKREQAALMGDQIFTDVWAAHNAGIIAILVPPIKDKKDPFTRFKRLLEAPVIKKYERRKSK